LPSSAEKSQLIPMIIFIISLPITISSEIQEIMQKQREALGKLAEKLAGEAKRDVQQSLDQLEVRIKAILLDIQILFSNTGF